MNSDNDVKENEQKIKTETEYQPASWEELHCNKCGGEITRFQGSDCEWYIGCKTPWCPDIEPHFKHDLKDEYSLGVDDNDYLIPLTDQEYDAMLGTKERYDCTSSICNPISEAGMARDICGCFYLVRFYLIW